MAARKEDLTHSLTNPVFNNPYYQKNSFLSLLLQFNIFFFFPFLRPRPGLGAD